MNEKNTIIISAFPACGKTYFMEHAPKGVTVLDSDSSKFHWSYTPGNTGMCRYPNPEWPDNYIQHIKDNIGTADVILISSHKDIREALHNANIPFIAMYPIEDAKAEWIGRCVLRGNDQNFIKNLVENFDQWVEDMEQETLPWPLVPTETLSDVVKDVRLHQFWENAISTRRS